MTQAQTMSTAAGVDVSIVVPVYNEEENVQPLYEELKAVMDAQGEQGKAYEVIFIDDGSRDLTLNRLRELVTEDDRVTVIEFMRNFGQTAATAAGIDTAKGRVIVPIDGDLQNDPADIPRVVAKLDEVDEHGRGWDIVSGWRKNRQDKALTRKLPSVIANKLVKKLTWTTEIHDFGCSLKAYRAEVIKDVRLYGEMHRFLPALCKWRGARVTEEVVNHRPRVAGESKYGLKRTVKVLLDLCTVKFLGDYLTKPIYFFGKLAMMTLSLSFLALFIAVLQKFGVLTMGDYSVKLNQNVLVLFSMMTFLMAVMFVMLGVMSELLVRIYHESQGRTPYKVRSATVGGQPMTGPGQSQPISHAGNTEQAA